MKDFTNPLPAGGQVIQNGDDYVIVFDWTKTADEIIAEAARIHGYRDLNCVRWYFVIWNGFEERPTLHQLDDERLRYFVETLHERLKKHAH